MGNEELILQKEKQLCDFKEEYQQLKAIFDENQLKLSGLDKDYENLKSNYHQLEVGIKNSNFLSVTLSLFKKYSLKKNNLDTIKEQNNNELSTKDEINCKLNIRVVELNNELSWLRKSNNILTNFKVNVSFISSLFSFNVQSHLYYLILLYFVF